MGMKRLIGTLILICSMQTASSQTTLQGDEGLACEAILCLAVSAGAPAECAPSIRRYFSISFRRFSDTLRGRLNFLNLCPIVTSDMASLKSALVNGSGRCDAASLNVETYVGGDESSSGYVSNQLPDYCASFYSSPYVQAHTPRYVGSPGGGGYWVEANDFEAALTGYNNSRVNISE